MWNPNRFIRFPKDILKAKVAGPEGELRTMEYGVVILLAFLINWEYRIEVGTDSRNETFGRNDQHDGWFYCTSATVTEHLGMTDDAQDKLFAKLRRYGLIETEVRGFPATKRFVKINKLAVVKACKRQ
jgi:hypothetical protein